MHSKRNKRINNAFFLLPDFIHGFILLKVKENPWPSVVWCQWKTLTMSHDCVFPSLFFSNSFNAHKMTLIFLFTFLPCRVSTHRIKESWSTDMKIPCLSYYFLFLCFLWRFFVILWFILYSWEIVRGVFTFPLKLNNYIKAVAALHVQLVKIDIT